MSARPVPLPERLGPVHGQRLLAADLHDLLALADHHRRRHVRALHATWGIGAGLVVDRHRELGIVGYPGVAYDNCGRLLVLCKRTRLPDPDRLSEPRVVALRAGREPREPSTVLHHVSADELELGTDVPLALLTPGETEPDLSVRRYARRAAPPIVAAGRARRGTLVADGTPHDWEATIDVSEAGFETEPVYVAAVGVPDVATGVPTVEIRDADPASFTVRVRVPAQPGGEFDGTELTTNPADLSWIAVLPQAPIGVTDAPRPTGPCVDYFEERFA